MTTLFISLLSFFFIHHFLLCLFALLCHISAFPSFWSIPFNSLLLFLWMWVFLDIYSVLLLSIALFYNVLDWMDHILDTIFLWFLLLTLSFQNSDWASVHHELLLCSDHVHNQIPYMFILLDSLDDVHRICTFCVLSFFRINPFLDTLATSLLFLYYWDRLKVISFLPLWNRSWLVWLEYHYPCFQSYYLLVSW